MHTERKEIIRYEGISKNFGHKSVLENVSFSILDGEIFGVIGMSGSGKTTLLNLITGYIWPSDGSVTVLGNKFGSVDIRPVRRKIGLISSALFERIPYGDSFRDVVVSGKFGSIGIYDDTTDDDISRADELTVFLGRENIADSPYRVLSFGERQSALIGRALMADPEILILDEPCEGLDIAARENILRCIDSLIGNPKGPVVLLVTHRVEEISSGITHAAVMKDGRIISTGTKKENLTSGILQESLGVDLELVRNNGRYYAHVKDL